jgi:hypothetical protein|nr:MAG TPA: hypothetical protein [Caudoviricetes sp.]
MYEKLNFKDRIVEKPNTYTVQTNDDGTVTLIPAFGNTLQEGTIINSKNMDHIEEGIKQLSNKVYVKDNYAVLTGTISVESNKVSGKEISLPNGFTSNNSFIIGFKWNEGYATKTILGNLITDGKEMTTNYMILAYGSSSKIDIRFYNPRSTKSTFNYELLLMKYKD